MTLDDYLKSLERFVDNPYGRQIRLQFQTADGKSELAMLAAPTREEYDQFCRLTAKMTAEEKQDARLLTDEQTARIAEQAGVDQALAAIFLNGYALAVKKQVQQK